MAENIKITKNPKQLKPQNLQKLLYFLNLNSLSQRLCNLNSSKLNKKLRFNHFY